MHAEEEQMRAAVLLLLLAGCATDCKVTLLPLEQVRAPENCGADVLPNFGCWKPGGPAVRAEAIAEDARDTGDTARLRTIGEEVWKCYHAVKEY